jgi:DNA-binding response OmpR family regulator
MDSSKTKNVLLVEDDKGVLDILTMFVEDMEMNIKVFGALCPHEARTIFNDKTMDLLICDINLDSDIDGVDLYNEFKVIDESIPVVFTSTDGRQLDRIKDSSNLLVLKKPFSEEILKVTLEMALNR